MKYVVTKSMLDEPVICGSRAIFCGLMMEVIEHELGLGDNQTPQGSVEIAADSREGIVRIYGDGAIRFTGIIKE